MNRGINRFWQIVAAASFTIGFATAPGAVRQDGVRVSTVPISANVHEVGPILYGGNDYQIFFLVSEPIADTDPQTTGFQGPEPEIGCPTTNSPIQDCRHVWVNDQTFKVTFSTVAEGLTTPVNLTVYLEFTNTSGAERIGTGGAYFVVTATPLQTARQAVPPKPQEQFTRPPTHRSPQKILVSTVPISASLHYSIQSGSVTNNKVNVDVTFPSPIYDNFTLAYRVFNNAGTEVTAGNVLQNPLYFPINQTGPTDEVRITFIAKPNVSAIHYVWVTVTSPEHEDPQGNTIQPYSGGATFDVLPQ